MPIGVILAGKQMLNAHLSMSSPRPIFARLPRVIIAVHRDGLSHIVASETDQAAPYPIVFRTAEGTASGSYPCHRSRNRPGSNVPNVGHSSGTEKSAIGRRLLADPDVRGDKAKRHILIGSRRSTLPDAV